MVSQVVQLGPFAGGLNTSSDASAIADNELSILTNLNVDLDGSLVTRLPMAHIPYLVDPGPGRILIIGSARINGVSYLIGSSDRVQFGGVPGGIFAIQLAYDANGLEFVNRIPIAPFVTSNCAIQIHNIVYILANNDSPNTGGVWDPTTATFTPDASAPRGSKMLFHKGRLFTVPGADFPSNSVSAYHLQISNPIPLTTPVTVPWSSANIVPVGQGDNENLIDILVVSDNLMLFKNNSTYIYQYDVQPSDGILRKINNNIGVSANFCALTHENEAYVYHNGKVYVLTNNTYIDASVKIAFETASWPVGVSPSESVYLSLIGDTIVLRYFTSMYALNLQTKTWSKWESTNAILNSAGKFVRLPTTNVTTAPRVYYSGVMYGSNALVLIKEDATNDDIEYTVTGGNIKTPVAIQCTIRTKVFSFDSPSVFKRLMWWGADMLSDGNITATAIPVIQTPPVTWNVLSTYIWNQLNTWDAPLVNSTFVNDAFADNFVFRRKFFKFLKSMRFRQLAFQVKFTSDGKRYAENALGPARLFSISAIVGLKQTVTQKVN